MAYQKENLGDAPCKETEWPENLKVQVEVHPWKKPCVAEMGKLLRWLKKMSVIEHIKVECGPPCSIAKVGSRNGIVATFRTSSEWKVLRKFFRVWCQEEAIAAQGLKMISRKWIDKPRGMLLCEEGIPHRGGVAACESQISEEVDEVSQSEDHRRVEAVEEVKKEMRATVE